MSVGVVNAVAAVKGVSALELPTPLYEVLDPDALDELLGGRGHSVARVRVPRLRVTVTSGGISVAR